MVSGDADALIEALLDPALALKNVERANATIYLEHLAVLYEAKRSDPINSLLTAEEIQQAINAANVPQSYEQLRTSMLHRLEL